MSLFPIKDFLSIRDIDSQTVRMLLKKAGILKKNPRKKVLKEKTLAMIFTKSSTRTRVSFETGIFQLGGKGIFLTMADSQIGRGETVEDTARVLSRYVDGIMIRTGAHDDAERMAKAASIPVINGLTDLLHPCQILADLLTISEHKPVDQNLNVLYMGDGNNVANSWFSAALKLGFKVNFLVPKTYNLSPDLYAHLRMNPQTLPANIGIGHEINEEWVRAADVIYTDVWVSMGQKNKEEKKQALKPFQINGKLLSQARDDVLVMHCLPAHRGEEITDEVLDGPRSIVFDQAENRLHLQKALMWMLMK